jgi:integrase
MVLQAKLQENFDKDQPEGTRIAFFPRAIAMIRLLCLTGCRASEIAGLR